MSKTIQWSPSRRTGARWRAAAASLSVLGLSALGFTAPAIAATTPIEFIYTSTIDATAVGGGTDDPLIVIYSFSPDLAPGSGTVGSGDPSTSIGYGPLESIRVQVGTQCSYYTGPRSQISVFNDAGTTIVEDSYAVQAKPLDDTFLGAYPIAAALFDIVDSDRTMFSDTSLPTTPGFAQAAEYAQNTIQIGRGPQRIDLLSYNVPFKLGVFDQIAAIATLKSDVAALNLSADLTERLQQPLDKASHFLTKGNERKADKDADKAINELIAFRTLVQNLKGHGLTGSQAQRLRVSVTDIINSFLTC